MKRVVGLSVLCFLLCGNVHADQDGDKNKNEYSVKSWSINMEQHGDEPIRVRTERKESNENGIVFQKKTSGTIDKNGRYTEDAPEPQPQPKVQRKKQWRLWNPFSRDDKETVREEVKAPEHWKDHAREHPGLPPCNQAPRAEAPKCPEPRTTAYPQNKNCWNGVQPRNQVPVYGGNEESRPVRFDRRRRSNYAEDPCNGAAPNPKHIIVHSCEFGDNEEGRPVTLHRSASTPDFRNPRVCPLEPQQKPVSYQQNYQEPRYQSKPAANQQNYQEPGYQSKPTPSQRNYQEQKYQDTDRSPEKVVDPWGFSDDFFRSWQEFDKLFNQFFPKY